MSAGLPHDAKLAEKSALKALDEDGRKASLASGEDNIKASAVAAMGGRTHASVMHALIACGQLKLTADSLCHLGDALLEVGCAHAAREAFGKAKEASEQKDLRAACGDIAARLALGSTIAEVSPACEAARKLCTSPAKQRALLAILQGLAGTPDEGFDTAQQAVAGLKPGDIKLAEGTLLACEMELAMYVEAAWPTRSAVRPERKQDKIVPDDTPLPSWRLGRALEKARVDLACAWPAPKWSPQS